MCIGGPALIYYVTPTEEELFMVPHSAGHQNPSPILTQSLQRYNPELQRRSLENRKEKQEDFDNFVGRLKEYAKSDKPGTLNPPFPVIKPWGGYTNDWQSGRHGKKT